MEKKTPRPEAAAARACSRPTISIRERSLSTGSVSERKRSAARPPKWAKTARASRSTSAGDFSGKASARFSDDELPPAAVDEPVEEADAPAEAVGEAEGENPEAGS